MPASDRYTCEEVFERLDDYLDRELRPEEMQMVQAHLEACARCASEHRFESGIIQGVREKLKRLAVPPDLMQKIRQRLEQEGGSLEPGH
jgi:anti-sigma factor (TIGR02949 family)